MGTEIEEKPEASVASIGLLGCDYMGNEFGASYLDSCCIEGRLYDLDNCDDEGNLYEPLEFLPCPKCNHGALVEGMKEGLVEKGFLDADEGKARSDTPKFSADISAEDVATFTAWWLKGYDERMAEQPNKEITGA